MSLGNCDYTKIFDIFIIVRHFHLLMAIAKKKRLIFFITAVHYLITYSEKVIYHTDCYNNFSLFTETIQNALQQGIKATVIVIWHYMASKIELN